MAGEYRWLAHIAVVWRSLVSPQESSHHIWPGGVVVDRLYACTPDEPATVWLYAVGMAEQLVTGDPLPSLYGTDLDGNEVDITASVAGRWAVVLFYRGDW